MSSVVWKIEPDAFERLAQLARVDQVAVVRERERPAAVRRRVSGWVFSSVRLPVVE